MDFKREKGKLYYYDDSSDKTAWYDINEGKFSTDNRQYTNLPPFINTNTFRKRGSLRGEWALPMERYLFLLAAKDADINKDNRDNSAAICKLFDRLLNVLPAGSIPAVSICAELENGIIELALKDKTFFTYLFKYIQDNYDDTQIFSYYLQSAHYNYLLKSFTICDDNYYGAECLHQTSVISSFYNLAKEYRTIIDFNTICYYLTHGLYDKWAYKWYIRQTHHNMVEELSDFLSMCLEMDYRPPKDKWVLVDLAVRKMYCQFLKNKDEAPLNLNPALAYHDNNFTVVIPNNVSDYRREADRQQNCVYTTYAPQVVRKETQVVFVRKNDDLENSYITCEVGMNGEIIQYLLKYNQNVPSGSAADQFRIKYQNYLNEIFGRA